MPANQTADFGARIECIGRKFALEATGVYGALNAMLNAGLVAEALEIAEAAVYRTDLTDQQKVALLYGFHDRLRSTESRSMLLKLALLHETNCNWSNAREIYAHIGDQRKLLQLELKVIRNDGAGEFDSTDVSKAWEVVGDYYVEHGVYYAAVDAYRRAQCLDKLLTLCERPCTDGVRQYQLQALLAAAELMQTNRKGQTT